MKYAVTFMALIWLALPQFVAAESSATLDGIKKSGTVRIGFRDNEPPMSFLDENKKPVGYSIELCTRIVNEIKNTLKKPDLAVKYVPVTAANRFQAIVDNKIDILCGSTTETISRAKLVDFTKLTFVTGASLLSLEKVNVSGISGLQGKKVGAVIGTTTIDHLAKALKESVSDAVIVPVDSTSEGMKALLAGKVDAFAADQVVLIGLAVTHDGPEKFAIADDVFSFEPFALAIRRNDSDFRLLANRVLSQLNRSGQITPIYVKWFGKFTKEVPTLLEAMYILNSTPE